MYNVFFPICICTFVYITSFFVFLGISWVKRRDVRVILGQDLLHIKNKMETFTIIAYLKATLDNNEALYLRFNLK